MTRHLVGLLIVAGVILATMAACSGIRAAECGFVTYYNATGHKTACGDRYTGREMYAAHRTLPCGTKLKVTDKRTGKHVRVVVRDRGPALWTGNDLDLSFAAGDKLGMIRRGRIQGCWG